MDHPKYSSLMDAVLDIPDPRKARGKRHRWDVLLTLISAALLCGQTDHSDVSRMSSLVSFRATSIARHSRVNSSITVSILTGLPSWVRVCTKS